MKKSLIAIIALFSSLSFSCTKETTKPATYPIEGLWIGTYVYTSGTNTQQTPQYFSYIIKPNGRLTVEGQDAGINYYAYGNWSLIGDTLKCSYIYTTTLGGSTLHQSSTAVFSKSGTLREGVWFNTDAQGNKINDPNQQGSFTMDQIH